MSVGSFDAPADLTAIPTSVLRELRAALAEQSLRTPLASHDLTRLVGRHHAERVLVALAGHGTSACLGILDAVLGERMRERRPPPELVWTGPEGDTAAARDTAVVLRRLFEDAARSVLLAGYSFREAEQVLQPLHRRMLEGGVAATFVIDIPQVEGPEDVVDHLATQLASFRRANWPFGPPLPRIYYDPRALVPGPPWSSMHAKCVVVDDERVFLSSANFTARGQERNIEAGVLLEDPLFAEQLTRQWLSLVDAGLLVLA